MNAHAPAGGTDREPGALFAIVLFGAANGMTFIMVTACRAP